jgi:lipopolysaccharide/colanic/teichoic acid biosynthesis glycosyltransferase
LRKENSSFTEDNSLLNADLNAEHCIGLWLPNQLYDMVLLYLGLIVFAPFLIIIIIIIIILLFILLSFFGT